MHVTHINVIFMYVCLCLRAFYVCVSGTLEIRGMGTSRTEVEDVCEPLHGSRDANLGPFSRSVRVHNC